jgi:hypothetical protein
MAAGHLDLAVRVVRLEAAHVRGLVVADLAVHGELAVFEVSEAGPVPFDGVHHQPAARPRPGEQFAQRPEHLGGGRVVGGPAGGEERLQHVDHDERGRSYRYPHDGEELGIESVGRQRHGPSSDQTSGLTDPIGR